MLVTTVGADSEAARLSIGKGNVDARGVGVPSNCPSGRAASGKTVDCTSGDDVVRYPMCDGCVDSGGRSSRCLWMARVSTNDEHVIVQNRG